MSAQDGLPPRGFAAHNYAPRVVGLALGFCTLASVFYENGSPWWVWLGPALHGFVWPHLAWWLARRSADPVAAEQRNLLVDQLAGGMWLAAMSFNLLPSALMVTLMAMDSAIGGGRRMLMRGLAANVLGLGVGLLVYGVHWQPVSSMLQVVACLPLLVLHPIVVGLGAHQALSKLSRQRAHLTHLSLHDPLSDLHNRRHIDGCIRNEFQRFQRSGRAASLVLMDFDHFKQLNDTLGHQTGDEAIRRFAQRLRDNLRTSDTAGRYGGEEFVVLLPDTNAQAAGRLMRRLQAGLHEQPLMDEVLLTVSMGAAELTPDIASPEAWVRLADQMLYRAKDLGRDRVVLAGEAARPPQHADEGARPPLQRQPVAARVLEGLEAAGIAAALFDPSDRLAWCNPVFGQIFPLPAAHCSFADIMRLCHAQGVGARIQTHDIDLWLAAADAKRRSQPHRSFTTDLHDGRLLRVEEVSMGDGWLIALFLPLADPVGAAVVRRLVPQPEKSAPAQEA